MTELKTHLKVEPYPYQKEGIAAGLKWKRFLLGDDCGLGKTLQSIGVVDTANAYPCLVICPSSLKINWQREFEKFTDRARWCWRMQCRPHGLIFCRCGCTMWRYATTRA